MSSFLGVDSAAAPALAQSLRGWTHQLDDALALVTEAEALSDLPTGVQSLLDSIGSDGRVLARAVDRAASMVSSFRIDLATFSPRMTVPRLGFGHPESGDAQSDKPGSPKAALQSDVGKQFGPRQVSGKSEPVDPGLVAGLQDQIEQDFIAGRDTADSIAHYTALLEHITGDATGVGAAMAMSLMGNGLPPQELAVSLPDGIDALFGRIAAAMAEGISPAESGLHPALFPTGYTAWHEYDSYTAVVAVLDRNELGDDQALRNQSARPHLQAVVNELPPWWAERSWLQAVLDGGEITPVQVERVKGLVGAFAQSSLDEFGEGPPGVVDTLHGPVVIDGQGRLTAFQAIGAAAATVSTVPSLYVGDSYAQFYPGFEFDEIEASIEYLATDQTASWAFFDSLGPAATAAILPLLGSRGMDDLSSSVVQNLSVAFGQASHELPTEFGVQVIQARPTDSVGFPELEFVPEYLFAHGTFADDFLAQAAAATLGLPNPIYGYYSATDPRVIILAPALAQGVGAQIVRAMADDGSLDELVWAEFAIHEIDLGSGSQGLISELVVQAASDVEASAALIAAAGSQLGSLDLDVANGLSFVLANNLPHYVIMHREDQPEAELLTAAQNIFAAGAGIDINMALSVLVQQELEAGLAAPADGWWRNTVWPSMMGHLDAQRYLAFEGMAMAHDDAIQNTQQWLSWLSTAGGAVFGLAGLATGGIVFGVAGLAATGLGAFSFALDEPTALQDLYHDELIEAYGSSGAGEERALLAALHSGAIDFPAGAGAEIVESDAGGVAIHVTTGADEVEIFELDTDHWTHAVHTSLIGADATMLLYPGDIETPLHVVEHIAPSGFDRPRRAAFGASVGFDDDHDE